MNILNLLAIYKNYYIRSAIYVSMINFLMILATFKKTYELNVSLFLIVPVGIIGVLLLGWLDYKFIMKKQMKHINKMNDIKEQLDKIELMIKGVRQ